MQVISTRHVTFTTVTCHNDDRSQETLLFHLHTSCEHKKKISSN